jgi:hypothetical protein
MGNRTFTGLPDGLVTRLTEIGRANSEMKQFYRKQQARFAAS